MDIPMYSLNNSKGPGRMEPVQKDAVIYYFSGTGNSYAVARDIAAKINAEVIPIAALIDSEKVDIPAEVVGVVFPDYHSSLPNIVKRFINKIDTFDKKYVFGVCTYGGKSPGPTMKYLKMLVESKGGDLAGGFAVHMPYNYIVPSLSLKKGALCVTLKDVPVEEQKRMFADWSKKLEIITDFINSRKRGVYETSAELLLKVIDVIKVKELFGKYLWLRMAGYTGRTGLSFSESRKLMDHGFYANEDCIGCGTCERICPVSNITLVENRPCWQHNCEQCFACLQWCPQSAIQFGKDTEGNTRYHHPTVEISDLVRYKSGKYKKKRGIEND